MRQVALLLTAIMLAGCTTVTVTPESALAPTQTYKSVVLTKVDSRDPAFSYLGASFQKGFIRRLNQLKGFSSVSDAASAPRIAIPQSAGTILVSATLTQVDKGSAVARLLIGMGAGREYVAAQIHLTTADGKPIGEFKVRKAYSGGFGIGGATLIDIDGLTQQLGEQCAQTLVDWSKGKIVAQAKQ